MKKHVILPLFLSMLMTVNPVVAFAQSGSARMEQGAGSGNAISAMKQYGSRELMTPALESLPQDMPVTRGEMAVFFDEIMNYQTKAAGAFADLPANGPYTEAALKAVGAGVMEGDNGYFYPDRILTRQEAHALLSNVFQVNKGERCSFQDADSITEWAYGAVAGMENQGFLGSGIQKGGKFQPLDPMTRGEITELFDQMADEIYHGSGEYDKYSAEGKGPGLQPAKQNVVINASGVVLKNKVIE